MAKDKKQSRRVSDIVIMIVIAISVALIVLELVNNIQGAL